MIGNIARSTCPSWFHLGQRVKLLSPWRARAKIKLLIVEVTHHLSRVLLLAQRLGSIEQGVARPIRFGPKSRRILASALLARFWTRGGQLALIWWRSTTCSQVCIRRIMPRNCTAMILGLISNRVLVYDALHQIMNVLLVHERSCCRFWLQIISLCLFEMSWVHLGKVILRVVLAWVYYIFDCFVHPLLMVPMLVVLGRALRDHQRLWCWRWINGTHSWCRTLIHFAHCWCLCGP